MASRLISPEDLEIHFNISKQEIEEYFEFKLSGLGPSYARMINHPKTTYLLLQSYIKGVGAFNDCIEQLHTKVLNNLESKFDMNQTQDEQDDVRIAKKIFDLNNQDLDFNVLAAKSSLERVYSELKLKQEQKVYNTQLYEGVMHMYASIYNDALSLPDKPCRRTQQSADLDIFNFSQQLLRRYFYNQNPILPSTVILLRQSIETKFLQSFGIEKFKRNRSDAIVSISKILNFCKSKKDKISIPVDVDLIIDINKWCNHYVHTGNFSFYTWEIEWAHHILKPLFQFNEHSISIDKNYFHNDNGFYKELKENLNISEIIKTEHKLLLT